MEHFFEMFTIGLLCVWVLMFLLWGVYYSKKNASIADIGWATGFVITAFVYLYLGSGYGPRKFLIFLLVLIWGIRLAWHLYQRFSIQKEDPRYKTMIQRWEGNINLKVLGLFLLQGFLAAVLSLPFLLISNNPAPYFTACEMFGVLAWGGAILGESMADRQLYLFKQNPVNQGKVCQDGLWAYSRHPNYFFEWLVWVAYFLMAWSAPAGWLALISPVVMLYLLLKVTGVPLAEEQAIKSKGELYRDYQKHTNAFWPWLKK